AKHRDTLPQRIFPDPPGQQGNDRIAQEREEPQDDADDRMGRALGLWIIAGVPNAQEAEDDADRRQREADDRQQGEEAAVISGQGFRIVVRDERGNAAVLTRVMSVVVVPLLLRARPANRPARLTLRLPLPRGWLNGQHTWRQLLPTFDAV